jgi:hypothetical protein
VFLPYLGIIVAPAVAAVVSVMEVSVRKDRAIYRSAIIPVIFYAAYDAGASLLLYTAFRGVAELFRENPTIAAAVVSGLVGPLLMRTKVPNPFQKNEAGGRQFVNAIAMLRRLQLSMSAVIDDRCAAAETDWILDVVLPALRAMPVDEVEDWITESIKVKNRGVPGRRARTRFIGEVRKANNDSISPEDRKHLMVQILIDTCGRRHVVTLVKRAKRYTAITAGPSRGFFRRRLEGLRRAVENRRREGGKGIG